MSTIKIREAVINDLPYIIEIMADDTLGRQREIYTAPLEQCYIDAFNNICDDKNSILLVVCDDEKVIGSLQITFTQYLSHKGSMRATIENVHVAENYRNLGIGTQLMKYAVNLARDKNCSIVQLTSNKTRKDAHRFYERLGFHATHEGMKLSLE
ncbi:MAG: GNAT family N-acetyltransferase [Ruminococcus sp.]|nr:GNAT family N-acetyltransferase [Ruminococcus sp.]